MLNSAAPFHLRCIARDRQMMKKGRVVADFGNRGFYFLREDGGAQIFAHIRNVVNAGKLNVDDLVEYDERVDARSGRLEAVNVRVIDAAAQPVRWGDAV
jgi:cold shock CspA family protein